MKKIKEKPLRPRFCHAQRVAVCVCVCVCAWRMLILELPPAADVRRVRVGHNNDTFAATGVVYLRLLNASQLTVLLSLPVRVADYVCWCICVCVCDCVLCVSVSVCVSSAVTGDSLAPGGFYLIFSFVITPRLPPAPRICA